MEGSSGSVNSQTRHTKRKWTSTEDAALILSMAELRSLGTHNADTGFKSGYLPELEKLLLQKLPNCGLKAKPHIESRLKTLKKEWSIVYDMVFGSHTSGFGWDDDRNMVTAEDAVWDAYVASHKEAATFKSRSFPFFHDLSKIYAKDRATGRDAQTVEDIIEEMNLEDVQQGEDNLFDSTNEENLTPNDVSRIGPSSAPTRDMGSGSSGRKRKRAEINLQPLTEAVNSIGADMKEACQMLSHSVQSAQIDILQEKLLLLPGALGAVVGLGEEERNIALQKFARNTNQVLIFFGTPEVQRLNMVKYFIREN